MKSNNATLLKVTLGVFLTHLFAIVWFSWHGEQPKVNPNSQKVVVQTIHLIPKQPTQKPKQTVAKQAPPKIASPKKAPPKKAPPKKETAKKVPSKRDELIAKAKEIVGKYNRSRGKVSSNSEEIVVPETIDQLEVTQVTPSGGYENLLASRLRQVLRLPEYGEVKILLTLDRTGKVKGVEIVSAKSKMNKDYVMKKIKTLTLPPFGKHLSANEQTFTLALQND